ncbi:hypothetical protein DBR46_06270 [Pseudomonas sp. KBW05]|nr:hypothetical protein DBR46_06270 [Pseudomonas sp. KBW05]
MWELACLRWHSSSQPISSLTHRYRRQASSHTDCISAIHLVIVRVHKCPAPLPLRRKSCCPNS